ncbi:adenine phosphoribosyltransferase [Aeromonas salmonicida]|uniref:adenine phosphoribosyltransferase n=1 Tax=Aeromonas salmonicida TaxID=645 RepID=UPI0030CA22B9
MKRFTHDADLRGMVVLRSLGFQLVPFKLHRFRKQRPFKATIDLLAEHYRDQGITKIVGTEARGFIFGAPVAFAMGLGFVPVRKPGKLPRAVIEESYALEYGTDTLQLHTDAIVPGDKVLVVDDLLATGGTVDATVKLIRRAGGEVADAAFIISLPSLGDDARLTAAGIKVVSLVELAGE